MKYFNLVLLFIFIIKINFSYANVLNCNDLKELIINNNYNQYEYLPKTDQVKDFGIEFYLSDDDEESFYYDNGIQISRLLNESINKKLDVGDKIIKIGDSVLEDLFQKYTYFDASNYILGLLKAEDLVIEIEKHTTEEKKTLQISKTLYDEPIEVLVDYNLEDITFINVKNNTYSAKYSYIIEWIDNEFTPYLNNIPDNYCAFKNINQNDQLYQSLWIPEIIEENKIDNIDTYDDFIYADIYFQYYEEGSVIKVEKHNNATFKTAFNLKEFPFDTQTFKFNLYTPEYNTDIALRSKYDYDKENIEAGWEYFLYYKTHPEWNYIKFDTGIEQDWYVGGEYFDNFYLELSAERKVSYYITKVIIPIFLILIICWSVFWINGLQLESRLTVTSVSFLALIAYNYVVEDDLPKLGYSTVLDSIILWSYVFAGMATILTIYSYKYCKKHNSEFSNIDLKLRYWGPITYLSVNGLLIFNGIKSMTAMQFLGRLL